MRGGNTLPPAATDLMVADELVERGVLEDETGHARVHELHDVFAHRNEIHHDDLRAWGLFGERSRDAEAVLVPQADVEEHHVWLGLLDERGISDARADDAQIGQPIEHRGERLAHEAIVVHDRNPDHVIGQRGAALHVECANRGKEGMAAEKLNLPPPTTAAIPHVSGAVVGLLLRSCDCRQSNRLVRYVA